MLPTHRPQIGYCFPIALFSSLRTNYYNCFFFFSGIWFVILCIFQLQRSTARPSIDIYITDPVCHCRINYFKEVCGSNGQIYRNACFMKCEDPGLVQVNKYRCLSKWPWLLQNFRMLNIEVCTYIHWFKSRRVYFSLYK